MVAIRGRGPEERWASGTGQSTRAIRNPPPRLCARTRLFLGVVAYSPRQSSPPLSQSSIRRSRTVAAESRRCVLHCAFLVSAGALLLLLHRKRRDLVVGRVVTRAYSSPTRSNSKAITKHGAAACISPAIRADPLFRRHRRRAEAPREPSRV
ncbi:uncharacterized protein LOC105203106 [Solenopsis invicta]|uniref:uncharacterized protein LOC105203106 n=1 Tax=Solenopsis invicta TaxID=13686 RepID=UPI00193DFD2D|nr:uncharacterized protein LOC105203106 [Solenopsis invicta]